MTTAGHARLAVELEQLAVELVTGAADVVRGLGRRDLLGHRDLSVGTKSTATDLVTQVDRAAERWLVEHLAATRPDDAVLGEEGGARPGSSPVRWLIDPIDGTVNFVLGIPHYAVSVAAELDGVVVAGAVVDVVSGETFRARRGAGAWLNETALSGPRDVPMERAVIGTGFGYDAAARTRQISIVAELLPRIADIRRMGAASLDLCSVAAGRLDGYFEAGLNPWDYAAGALIAAEAGCRVTGLRGRPASAQLTAAAGVSLAAEFFAVLELLGADSVSS
jgi:myo-inositol-1(or 4)-monophosphatase